MAIGYIHDALSLKVQNNSARSWTKNLDSMLAHGVHFLYTGDMDLVTVAEAAKEMFCTTTAIYHHIKGGRIKKHPIGGYYTKRYYVDMDEVRKIIGSTYADKVRDQLSDNLITPAEASKLIYLDVRMITYYVNKGYIKKHLLPGSTKLYVVDRDEVLAQKHLVAERLEKLYSDPKRIAGLRDRAKTQKRVNGKFAKND